MRSRRCCHYQIGYSAWVSKASGPSQVWSFSWVSVLPAVLQGGLSGLGPQLEMGSVSCPRLGDTQGRWGDRGAVKGHRWLWWGAEEKPSLGTVRELTFSKCWVVHATWHYESCWIFCHEATNEVDSHHIHQLVEQIYPLFLSLSEWDFTCG